MRLAPKIVAALCLSAVAAPAFPQPVPVVQVQEQGVTAVDAWRADPSRVFEGREIDLKAFRWIARPVVVFADTPADPAFSRQVELLLQDADSLAARDVVIVADADPAAGSEVRRKLRPRGFMLVVMGKDGEVELRKPAPWHVREITRTIDKMPLRKQELREERRPGVIAPVDDPLD